jgi:hypothetical protein
MSHTILQSVKNKLVKEVYNEACGNQKHIQKLLFDTGYEW